jgi:uncharacterized protein
MGVPFMVKNSQTKGKPNRLIKEKSPYLLQHAYNPVDWYPWNDDAFQKAKADDKPVFVSIGYSTCHWCHVMEKECFEDIEVAELMNQTFVCIKVDREERPDLDAAYMAVCQSMGRNCGWPLNVIMTFEKNPFFVASYIPKNDRYGSVGMVNLVPQIGKIWRTRRGEMESIGKKLREHVETLLEKHPESKLDKNTLDDAYEQLFLRFDQENGGFGGTPKFPSPHNLVFLLRYGNWTKEKTALNMVEKTLRAMRLGGIFDQIGFGFHRYSTDSGWLVPHFEKMLYDQALLVLAYVEAYQAFGAPKFKLTAIETLDYVLRDLAALEGGFYSAEDADSEGEEGKFYLWTKKEIERGLQKDADLAIKLFEIKAEGNYIESPKGRNGKNILHFATPLEKLASESNLTIDELISRLGKIRSILFKIREKRIHPSKDDKILTDWNGLMIAALARASQVLGEKRYFQAAIKAANFILQEMKMGEGILYHRYAKGERAVLGFLDDYAYLVFGLIELYETSFDENYLQIATDLTKNMIDKFWDQKSGGFFFTDKKDNDAVPRLKQTYDGAMPSGNSMALLNLLRLARLSGESYFDEYAENLLNTFSEEIKNQPLGHTFMLTGLEFVLGPNFMVVLVGDPVDKDTIEMVGALRKKYLPNLTVKMWKPEKEKSLFPGVIYEKIDGKTTAYVCRGQICLPPTNRIEKMLELLKN